MATENISYKFKNSSGVCPWPNCPFFLFLWFDLQPYIFQTRSHYCPRKNISCFLHLPAFWNLPNDLFVFDVLHGWVHVLGELSVISYVRCFLSVVKLCPKFGKKLKPFGFWVSIVILWKPIGWIFTQTAWSLIPSSLLFNCRWFQFQNNFSELASFWCSISLFLFYIFFKMLIAVF